MKLIHLTYQTSQISLAYLKCALKSSNTMNTLWSASCLPSQLHGLLGLFFAASAERHERILHGISLAQEKDQNSKYEVCFLQNAYLFLHHFKVEKSKVKASYDVTVCTLPTI